MEEAEKYIYNAHKSVTQALHFYHANKKKVGEIVRVKMRFNKRENDYELVFTGSRGDSLTIISGLRTGVDGIESMAVYSILTDAGFSVTDKFIRNNTVFHLSKKDSKKL